MIVTEEVIPNQSLEPKYVEWPAKIGWHGSLLDFLIRMKDDCLDDSNIYHSKYNSAVRKIDKLEINPEGSEDKISSCKIESDYYFNEMADNKEGFEFLSELVDKLEKNNEILNSLDKLNVLCNKFPTEVIELFKLIDKLYHEPIYEVSNHNYYKELVQNIQGHKGTIL